MGETYPLHQLMLGIAVASANDAAMAVAEGLWGSEEAYLDAVNKRIQQLGMTKSVFRSVHGLPPSRGELPDETTARDMSKLAQECLHHQNIHEWTGTKSFKFRPEEAEHFSTNHLLQQMEECDGLKTGYIAAAGFCITATAARGNVRVITVIMGHPDSKARFLLAKQILSEGLDSLKKDRVVAKDAVDKPNISVENGTVESVPVAVKDDIWATTRTADWDKIKVVWDLPQKIAAPVTAGKEIGEVRAELNGQVLGRSKIVLGGNVEEASWVSRTEKSIRSFLSTSAAASTN
jgi:D-alanyl-D-alanine carboxypeptidase (penicillin-binding protein 5/6)